jgi:hypothetical protein
MSMAGKNRHLSLEFLMKLQRCCGALAVIFLAGASACAQQALEVTQVEDGIQEITGWPCEEVDGVGFVDYPIVAITCPNGRETRLIFASLETGMVIEGHMIPNLLWGGGVLKHRDLGYWVAVANDAVAAEPELPVSLEAVLLHDRPANSQSLMLYDAHGEAPVSIGLVLSQNEMVVGAHFNAAGNCAVLRTQTGPGRTYSASTAQLVLLDFDQLFIEDMLPRMLELDGLASGVTRLASTPESRIDNPSRQFSGLYQATCIRDAERHVSLVFHSITRSGETHQLWTGTIQFASAVGALTNRPIDLLDRTDRRMVFYPGDEPERLIAAVSASGTLGLNGISLLEIGGEGEVGPVQPVRESLAWQYFEPVLGAGLAIHVGFREPERGPIVIVDCSQGDCQDKPTGIVVQSPVYLLGTGFLQGRQIFRVCVDAGARPCAQRVFLVDFKQFLGIR